MQREISGFAPARPGNDEDSSRTDIGHERSRVLAQTACFRATACAPNSATSSDADPVSVAPRLTLVILAGRHGGWPWAYALNAAGDSWVDELCCCTRSRSSRR